MTQVLQRKAHREDNVEQKICWEDGPDYQGRGEDT